MNMSLLRVISIAGKLPKFTYPVIFNPLVKLGLHSIGFKAKWLVDWREEFKQQRRIVAGYDLAIDGFYRNDEIYLKSVHRRFLPGYVDGYSSFVIYKVALMVSWRNPYNIVKKFQAYKAILIGRVTQDVTMSSSWKHTLNGLLWGFLLSTLLGA